MTEVKREQEGKIKPLLSPSSRLSLHLAFLLCYQYYSLLLALFHLPPFLLVHICLCLAIVSLSSLGASFHSALTDY